MSSTTPLPPESSVNESTVRLTITLLKVTYAIATVAVPLRFVAQWKLRASFWAEDWLILLALTLATGSLWTSESFTQELDHHFESYERNVQSSFYKKIYASEPLSDLAVAVTKLSILTFYCRIFGSSQWFQVSTQVMKGVVMCGGITISIASLFQCNPIHKVWDIAADGICINAPIFFFFNPAFNSFTNLGLLALPLYPISTLKVSWVDKTKVFCIFVTMGGLVIVISILRLILLDLTSHDTTWSRASPTIWSCMEAQVGISCACVASLYPLLRDAARNLGDKWRAITKKWQRSVKVVDEENFPPGIMVSKKFGVTFSYIETVDNLLHIKQHSCQAQGGDIETSI